SAAPCVLETSFCRSWLHPNDCAAALLLLRFFDYDDLVRVTHALALVGLRWTIRADFGGHLADLLLVDSLDQDLGLRRRFDLDALRHRMHHRMREAQGQIQLVTLRLRAIADTDQRE